MEQIQMEIDIIQPMILRLGSIEMHQIVQQVSTHEWFVIQQIRPGGHPNLLE